MRNLVRATIATAVLLLLTGLLYPLAMTAVGQLAFNEEADGSLLTVDGTTVGSSLIGQQWTGDQGFYGRPSAIDYDASTSGGSNLGPTNRTLADDIEQRARAIIALEGPYHPGLTTAGIPVDLLTSSASGLDPDISPAAAAFEAPRVAAVTGQALQRIQALIDRYTRGRDLGFLGEPRVNVLELNLALRRLTTS